MILRLMISSGRERVSIDATIATVCVYRSTYEFMFASRRTSLDIPRERRGLAISRGYED